MLKKLREIFKRENGKYNIDWEEGATYLLNITSFSFCDKPYLTFGKVEKAYHLNDPVSYLVLSFPGANITKESVDKYNKGDKVDEIGRKKIEGTKILCKLPSDIVDIDTLGLPEHGNFLRNIFHR